MQKLRYIYIGQIHSLKRTPDRIAKAITEIVWCDDDCEVDIETKLDPRTTQEGLFQLLSDDSPQQFECVIDAIPGDYKTFLRDRGIIYDLEEYLEIPTEDRLLSAALDERYLKRRGRHRDFYYNNFSDWKVELKTPEDYEIYLTEFRKLAPQMSYGYVFEDGTAFIGTPKGFAKYVADRFQKDADDSYEIKKFPERLAGDLH